MAIALRHHRWACSSPRCSHWRHRDDAGALRDTSCGHVFHLSTIEQARFLRLTTLSVAAARARAFSAQFEAQQRNDLLSPATTTIDDLQASRARAAGPRMSHATPQAMTRIPAFYRAEHDGPLTCRCSHASRPPHASSNVSDWSTCMRQRCWRCLPGWRTARRGLPLLHSSPDASRMACAVASCGRRACATPRSPCARRPARRR